MPEYILPQFSVEQMLKTVKVGLKKPPSSKKVIIIGAGMAGLVAASLLKRAGHEVIIIEADNRVGGRIYTMRAPFYGTQYLEAGAMRIPETHLITLEYIRKFKLPLQPFINTTPYDLFYMKGKKTRLMTYEQNPDILGFPVAPHERGKTAKELLQLAIQPVTDFLNLDPQKNWPLLVQELDKYSMDSYLRYNPYGYRLSPGAIEMIKVILTLQGLIELSFLDIFREFMILFTPNIRFYQIAGGNDQLSQAFLSELRENIYYRQKVKKMIQHHNQVSIYTVHQESLAPFQFTADFAIVTIPFSVLKLVEIEPYESISPGKWKAIRELHYVGSTKIGIQFKHPFWEAEGLFGGQTVTDLPIRYVQYPSHQLGQKRPGVILASYTWEDDAIPWDSLRAEERLEYAMRNLSAIHGNRVYGDFLSGASHSWLRHPYSGGAFAMFKPEQATELSPHLSKPEGRIHFAGEHTSSTHAWIQSAIESGIRVAHEVNDF